ncbi:MAG: hypothetical protein M3O78_05725, partial [Chloroflexota bacterium]|nr:hypothetical protein [Chloroflexota bacterium]
LTEPPATLLVALALLLALGPSSGARAAELGVLVGLSLVFSVQLLPAGVVVLVFALVMDPADARSSRAGAMILGTLTPLAVAAAWLVVVGALPAAFDAIVTYPAAYRGASGDYGVVLAAPVAAWTILASLFLIGPALLGAALVGRIPQPGRGMVIASLLWIGLSLVLFVVQGRFYAHYAIPLAVPLGILAGLGLKRLGESLLGSRGYGVRALIVLPLVITCTISLVAGVASGAMQLAPVADDSARMQAVSDRLRDIAAGTLLVWGNEPRLYDLAGRAPATQYSYLYPLTTPGYSTRAMIDELALKLAADPPRVVVDAGSPGPGQPGFLPLLIHRPVMTDGRDLDLLNPLRTFVAERYELVATVAGWPVYVLRSNGPEAAN